MGSETPMHPSRTPLHPYMTPMRDPGGLFSQSLVVFHLETWGLLYRLWNHIWERNYFLIFCNSSCSNANSWWHENTYERPSLESLYTNESTKVMYLNLMISFLKWCLLNFGHYRWTNRWLCIHSHRLLHFKALNLGSSESVIFVLFHCVTAGTNSRDESLLFVCSCQNFYFPSSKVPCFSCLTIFRSRY